MPPIYTVDRYRHPTLYELNCRVFSTCHPLLLPFSFFFGGAGAAPEAGGSLFSLF